MSSSSGTTDKKKGKAKRTGEHLVACVLKALKQSGYSEFWNHKAQAFKNRNMIGGKQYLPQLPVGTTIYDKKRTCDFLVINRAKFPKDLIIECIWQKSSGSVDEKYPFLLFNIVKTGIPTVILLDGGGYKSAAMEWLKEQVDPNRALIHVWTMAEFQQAVDNGFLG
jgi:hypothetical protein